MIDIAIPPILRRDETVRRLMNDVKSGKPDALDHLYARLLADIPDVTARQLLADNRRGEADAKARLYAYLEQRSDELANRYLYPSRESAQAQVDASEAVDSWAEQIEVVRHAAERLWRDDFLTDISAAKAGRRRGRILRFWSRPTADRSALEQAVFRSWLLMLLYVEMSLYAMRSNSNYESREGVQTRRGHWKRDQATRQSVAQIVKKYQRRLRRWDWELYRVTGRRFFRRYQADAQRLRAMSKVFGPEGLHRAHEEAGWGTQARDAGNELYYRSLDALRRESFRAGHLFVALWSLIQKWTTGYGTKPTRFARTTLFVIATFSLLFFANDYFNPGVRANARFCPAVNFRHTPPWEIAVHYLYVAVSNLTSLGTNTALAQYCGGMMTELLLVAATLTGYFLLATLAALFFQQIRDADS